MEADTEESTARRSRRRGSSARHIRGDRTIAELAVHFGVHPNHGSPQLEEATSG